MATLEKRSLDRNQWDGSMRHEMFSTITPHSFHDLLTHQFGLQRRPQHHCPKPQAELVLKSTVDVILDLDFFFSPQ